MCVHSTHCCVLHGCKYGDHDCPVYLGFINQTHACESCSLDWNYSNGLPPLPKRPSSKVIEKRRAASENSIY